VYGRDLPASLHDCPRVRILGLRVHGKARKTFALSCLAEYHPRYRGESNVLLMHQSFISLALLIATTLVAGFFAYIHSIKRQTYLLLWTAGWAVFALHYVGPTLAPSAAGSQLQSA